MLLLNTDMWKSDRIIKLHSSDRWGDSDSAEITRESLSVIKDALQKVIDRGEEMILIVDLSVGNFPPLLRAMEIAAFFFSMKTLIRKGLAFTLIYATTERQESWIDNILSFYTPIKPVKKVTDKQEIKEKLAEYKLTHVSPKPIPCSV